MTKRIACETVELQNLPRLLQEANPPKRNLFGTILIFNGNFEVVTTVKSSLIIHVQSDAIRTTFTSLRNAAEKSEQAIKT